MNKDMHDDLKQLQGTWSVRTLELDGQQMPESALDDATIRVNGDRFATTGMGSTYKGKLSRDQIAGEAVPNLDDKNESEPVIKCWIRVDGKDIPEGDRLPRELYLADYEAEVKIHCGNRPMGYSLFHGIWEYFYEKVVFFF